MVTASNFPEKEINALAQQHGLAKPVHFHFDSPDMRGYEWLALLGWFAKTFELNPKGAYNHHTKNIFISPKLFASKQRLAFYTAHEVGHAVTLEKWPMLLHDLAYWPVILSLPLLVSVAFSWWLFFPTVIATYLLHPFEIMANSYARKWVKEYSRLLEDPS